MSRKRWWQERHNAIRSARHFAVALVGAVVDVEPSAPVAQLAPVAHTEEHPVPV
jgi:hypothetical protein